MTNINPMFDHIYIKQTAANGYCELNARDQRFPGL